MNFFDFSSEPPAQLARSGTDVKEVEETFRAVGFDIDCRQMKAGRFHCKTAAAMFGEHGAIWQRCDKSVFIHAETPPGNIYLTIPVSSGGPGKFQGASFSNSELLVFKPGAELDLKGSDFTGGDIFFLPENRFHEIAESLCPEAISLKRNTACMFQGDRECLYGIRRLIENLVADATTHQDPEHLSAVVARIISWIADSDNRTAGERLIGNKARGLIARRTRDFLMNHYRDPILIEEICRELGVSLRTLHRSFREYFDVSLMQYLQILRLDKARRDLVAGDPSVHSVTEIALNHGFTHLGRFSVKYRAHFGESPSETLALSGR